MLGWNKILEKWKNVTYGKLPRKKEDWGKVDIVIKRSWLGLPLLSNAGSRIFNLFKKKIAGIFNNGFIKFYPYRRFTVKRL